MADLFTQGDPGPVWMLLEQLEIAATAIHAFIAMIVFDVQLNG